MRKVFILCFLCICQLAFAQYPPVYPDAGSWNTLSISYGLTKKISFVFAEELRIKENYSRINLFYTNVGFEYKWNKFLKTSIVYRNTQKYRDDNRFSFRHRLMWDVTVKYPIHKKMDLSYRHRLQVENRDINSSSDGYLPEWYSRNKVELTYKINKKLSPYISAELRYQIHDPRSVNSDKTWHRNRYQGGFDYQVSDKSKVGVYYLIQHEYNIELPETIYITGLEYSLSLHKL